jgi:hypothetical protein
VSDDHDIQPISIGLRLPDAYDEPRVVKSAKVDGGSSRSAAMVTFTHTWT